MVMIADGSSRTIDEESVGEIISAIEKEQEEAKANKGDEKS